MTNQPDKPKPKPRRLPGREPDPTIEEIYRRAAVIREEALARKRSEK